LIGLGSLGILAGAAMPGRVSADDMAFTVKIQPTGVGSFNFQLQNDSREEIIGITVEADPTVQQFESIYAGTVTRTARVLEPQYGASRIGLVREVWKGIQGRKVSDLTSSPDYPSSPTSRNIMTGSFSSPVNIANYYGQRIHGYFMAPETGTYTFWLTSDDEGKLYIGEIGQTETHLVTADVNTK